MANKFEWKQNGGGGGGESRDDKTFKIFFQIQRKRKKI